METKKFLNANQVWALSPPGSGIYRILLDAGLDMDVAFEVTLQILGENTALELEDNENAVD